MKKHVLIATGLAVLSTSAFATKARMTSLGQDSGYGSHYMSDSRNVFRNAANVNSTKNYVVTEWGTAAATASTATAPGAEGGFFREAGAFSYGLYLGSDLESQNAIRTAGAGYAGTTGIGFGVAGAHARDNELDVVFGGDMGVEWGVRASYASGNDESGTPAVKEKQNSLGLGAGIIMGDLNVYLNLGLNDKTENANNTNGSKFEGDSMVAGAGYNWMNYTFFGSYESRGAEFTTTGVAKNETTQKIITVGAGHIKEVSATSRLNMDLAYKNTKNEDKDGTTATNNREVKLSQLPLTVGFETDATSWLSVRGSISQNLFLNNRSDKTGSTTLKSTDSNTTTVAAGATLNFGKLKVDGSIGNNGTGGTANAGKSGVLDTDRLLTQVAVHYWF